VLDLCLQELGRRADHANRAQAALGWRTVGAGCEARRPGAGHDAPFVNNYGVWSDEFVELGLEGTLDHRWPDAHCYFGEGREVRVGRGYGRCGCPTSKYIHQAGVRCQSEVTQSTQLCSHGGLLAVPGLHAPPACLHRAKAELTRGG
jgi:hypothetical protein